MERACTGIGGGQTKPLVKPGNLFGGGEEQSKGEVPKASVQAALAIMIKVRSEKALGRF